MKTRRILIAVPLILLSMMGLFSCKDSSIQYRRYTANVPRYMSYDELRKPVKSTAAIPIVSSGKIYIKDNYLFVNEKYKGIHVFDNSDPASPSNIAFIDIPGNVDLAVKGNYLFADTYVDLIVLDISNISQPVEVARIKDIFPYTIPEISGTFPISAIDKEKGVIVGWQVCEITEEVDENMIRPYYYFDKGAGLYMMNETSSGLTQTVGTGGSLARFIIHESQFYGLNNSSLQAVNISQPTAPVAGTKIETSRMVETIFIDGENLFVGTQTGMLIYNISEPSSPVYEAAYDHFQSCDPVIVKDKLAYVTLRAGNRCGNWQNVMEVIDLKNIQSPVLMKSYTMSEPYGLGIDEKTLFVCDGEAGLKIYNATDPLQIDMNLLKHYTNLKAYDVIPYNGILIMIAQDGIYQYNYADLQNIKLLSKIPIGAI